MALENCLRTLEYALLFTLLKYVLLSIRTRTLHNTQHTPQWLPEIISSESRALWNHAQSKKQYEREREREIFHSGNLILSFFHSHTLLFALLRLSESFFFCYSDYVLLKQLKCGDRIQTHILAHNTAQPVYKCQVINCWICNEWYYFLWILLWLWLTMLPSLYVAPAT